MKKKVPMMATGTAMAGIKCRSEILKKNKYNQEYQNKCFQQCFFNLFDRCIQKIFCTENSECMNPFGNLADAFFITSSIAIRISLALEPAV